MQKKTVNTTVFDSMGGGGVVEPTTSNLQARQGGGVKSDISKNPEI